MTSLRQFTQHVTTRSSFLRSSYVEISRFIRTRHHGTSSRTSTICSRRTNRSFGTIAEPETVVTEALDKVTIQEALEDYRATRKDDVDMPLDILD